MDDITLSKAESRLPVNQELKERRSTLFACRTRLNIYCGCGFQTGDIDQGEAHARLKGHTIHIVGEIKAQR